MGNIARIPVARLGTAALRRVTLPAAGLWKKSGGKTPPDPVEAIMQACVLWYDISKQQATNEGMAETPVLRDLSGNGHDATCHNFAWSGMSGIGGYNMNSNKWTVYSNAQYDYPNNETIHITKVSPINQDFLIAWLSEHGSANIEPGTEFTLPAIRFKVTGIKDNELRAYSRGDNNGYSQVLSNGVEYYFEGGTFLQSSNGNCGFQIGWVSVDKTEREVDITVELLPLYPDALVSDGVDDYAQVTGLPILTKEKGYTVIAKRHWIGDINSHSQGLASKTTDASFADGAFCFECVAGNGSSPFNRTFATADPSTGVNYIDSFVSGDFSYMTSKKYNSVEFKNVGNGIDTDALVIFRLTTAMNNFYSGIALYSLLLFDRDLTDNEIEWVKKNMIEGGGVMKYDWARRPWYSYLTTSGDNRGTGSVTSYRLTVNAVRSSARVFETNVSLPSMESYRVKVSNLPEGVNIEYSGEINGRETGILTISKDGIYEIPPIEEECKYIGFQFDKKFENENVIIQQLLS